MIRFLLAIVLVMAVPTTALAEPRLASKGPYAEASLGATAFVGQTSEFSRPGPAFALRGGIDLFSWLSVGARIELHSHRAVVPPPPDGEYFQVYHGAGDARLSIPVGALSIFADGGVGLAMMSTNVLAKVDVLDPGERFSPVFSAGGGVEYQLLNRHYAFGLAGHWHLYPAFDAAQAAGGRAYLRYTY